MREMCFGHVFISYLCEPTSFPVYTVRVSFSALNNQVLKISSLVNLGFFLQKLKFSNGVINYCMGCDLCHHSTMNKHHYSNIFPLIRLGLGREIQGVSFDIRYAVGIM